MFGNLPLGKQPSLFWRHCKVILNQNAHPLHRHARAWPWHPRVEEEMATRSRGGRGVALSSAISAAPRDQLMDAKPKAWHDEDGPATVDVKTLPTRAMRSTAARPR